MRSFISFTSFSITNIKELIFFFKFWNLNYEFIFVRLLLQYYFDKLDFYLGDNFFKDCTSSEVAIHMHELI